MIEYIKYKFELRKLFKIRERIRSKYAIEIEVARKEKKDRIDIQYIEHCAWSDEEETDEEISILVTNYLLEKSTKHFIPIPPREETEMWEKSSKMSDRFVLTNVGVTKVRSLLRNESKEKRDVVLVFIAAITGLLGAATGLIAIINK